MPLVGKTPNTPKQPLTHNVRSSPNWSARWLRQRDKCGFPRTAALVVRFAALNSIPIPFLLPRSSSQNAVLLRASQCHSQPPFCRHAPPDAQPLGQRAPASCACRCPPCFALRRPVYLEHSASRWTFPLHSAPNSRYNFILSVLRH